MTNSNLAFLKKLLDAFAPSGCEDAVRNIVIERIRPFVKSLRIDGMGNLIATMGDENKLFVCAHMDEVGFMITGIRSDGCLRFSPVGGVDPKNLPAKRVLVGEDSLVGVILARPVHFSKGANGDLQFSDLVIDIGATSSDEAEKLVSVGDFAGFDTETVFLTDAKAVMAKALDNRLGCFLLCELISSGELQNGTFVFTVQEETGLRGATAMMEKYAFPVGIALDTTTANDLPGISPDCAVCRLGGGAVISFADGATIYDRDVVRSIMMHLNQQGIACQTKTKRTGGNEASAIEKAGVGAKSVSISTPCRYIHGALGLVRFSDLDQTMRAVAETVHYLEGGIHA